MSGYNVGQHVGSVMASSEAAQYMLEPQGGTVAVDAVATVNCGDVFARQQAHHGRAVRLKQGAASSSR